MKKINILFAIILMAGLVTLAHATQKITQICYQSGSRLICHNVQNNQSIQKTTSISSNPYVEDNITIGTILGLFIGTTSPIWIPLLIAAIYEVFIA